MFLKRLLFRFLSQASKVILPSYRNRDLTKLSKVDKIFIGIRYWITKNYFDGKEK